MTYEVWEPEVEEETVPVFQEEVIWKAGVFPLPLEVKVMDQPGAPFWVRAEVLETDTEI